MIIWHRNRRGRGGTTPRCRSRNIANNTFSEGWLQKSNEFAGLRTAPATHHAKNTANTTFSCGMLQNAGFGTIPCGGGGGVVANREPGSYISGQIIATSHDLTPNGGLVREIPLFQGNLGWWNIIIWPDIYIYTYIYIYIRLYNI